MHDLDWKARQYQALGLRVPREGFLAPNLLTLLVAVGFNKTTCLIAEKSLSHWSVPNSILRSTAEYTFLAVCQPCDPAMYVTSFNNVSLPSFSTALTVSPVMISSSPAVKSLRSKSPNANSLPTCSNGKHTCGQNCGLTTTSVALASIPDFTRLPCLVDRRRWSLTAYCPRPTVANVVCEPIRIGIRCASHSTVLIRITSY